LKPK